MTTTLRHLSLNTYTRFAYSLAGLLMAAGCGDYVDASEPEAANGVEEGASEGEPGASAYGQLEQALIGSCGSDEALFSSLLFAADFFPPETPASAAVFALLGADPLTLTACAEIFGVADMRSGCDTHDQCYATLGSSKESCDVQARSDWKDPCDRYDSFFGSGCEVLCRTQAEAMFEAVRDHGHDAYNAAQSEARQAAGPDVVKFRTEFTGSNQCLDIVNSSSRSQLQMATCANVTGQSWVAQPTPTASTFKFQTSFSGSGRCLDIVGGRPQMAACGNFSGQLWTMHPVEGRPGAFRLTNAFTGVGQCLDIIDGEPAMAPCGNFTGQFWLPRDQ